MYSTDIILFSSFWAWVHLASSSVAFAQRICTYDLFSFFKAVMVYNVAVDSELANTEPQLPGEIQDSVPLSFGSYFCQLINMRSYLCVSV